MAIGISMNWDMSNIPAGEREAVVKTVTDRMNEKMGNAPPAGGLFHAEGPTDDGNWWGFDLFETEEAFDTFYSTILEPAINSSGYDIPARRRKLAVAWDTTQLGKGE